MHFDRFDSKDYSYSNFVIYASELTEDFSMYSIKGNNASYINL